MKWRACALLASLSLGLALANGPRPHSAEGMVVVTRKRSGTIKSVKVGNVKLVSEVVQPNSQGRKQAEALAQEHLERIAEWDGRMIKVEGLSGYQPGIVRQGRIQPGRAIGSLIQVARITSPTPLTEVPLKREGNRVLHPAGGSFEVFGPGAEALKQSGAESVVVQGYVFTDSMEIYVEGFREVAAEPTTPPVGDLPQQTPTTGDPPQRQPVRGIVGELTDK